MTPPTSGAVNLTGGPDAFGYTFIDSSEAGGPAAGAFVDISATGTPVLLGDDADQQVPIGFNFGFYNGSFSQVFIVSNGHLSFGGGSAGAFTNECPIDGTASMDMIAPYWDDLDPGDDGALAYHETFANCPLFPPGSTATQCAIFQWEEYDFFPGDGVAGGTAGTFQTILYDDGRILHQYQAGSPGLDGASATIAISNDGGANSLTYGCDSGGQVAAGDAILYELGNVGDLVITKTGDVSDTGPTVYTLDVVNNGPDDQTGVVVTDVLPVEMDYVSNSCGGSEAGGTFTWNIGALANGASASCNLTLNLNTGTCVGVSNTATVTGDNADPSGNSSSTASNGAGGNAVADPSFEDGTPNGFWAEASTNFGTPVCDVGSCGTGTGTGPRTGAFWTWFGGIAAFEEGSMTQSVLINPGSTTLTFWLELIVCDSASDYMEVTIDGTQVFLIDGSDPSCGTLGYHQEVADISGFDDGGMHTLAFHSEIFGNNGGGTNFFLDDVEIPSAPVCVAGGPQIPIIEIPTTSPMGLIALALLLGGVAIFRSRKRQTT
ncbi:MAG: DUF11 domain-containing protein [Thermoanaerobaculia bacterium]|nr:DUF11 domain-containing protein [Thermoanaerobaculia bacterium]